MMTAKAINIGIMAIPKYLATLKAVPELLAEASSFVARKAIRPTITIPLTTAVSPTAAAVVTVVTVLIVTVVIICFYPTLAIITINMDCCQ